LYERGVDSGPRGLLSEHQPQARRPALRDTGEPERVPVDELVMVTRALDHGLHVAQTRLLELPKPGRA
jgi:hypothetical protein